MRTTFRLLFQFLDGREYNGRGLPQRLAGVCGDSRWTTVGMGQSEKRLPIDSLCRLSREPFQNGSHDHSLALRSQQMGSLAQA